MTLGVSLATQPLETHRRFRLGSALAVGIATFVGLELSGHVYAVPADYDYVAPPPPPPPPPKLPLRYFGEGNVESGSDCRAFQTNGDSVYIVAEGEARIR